MYLFSVNFFFFKQKTAYEMRISDWSSDVCSSDLIPCRPGRILPPPRRSSGYLRRLRQRHGVGIYATKSRQKPGCIPALVFAGRYTARCSLPGLRCGPTDVLDYLAPALHAGGGRKTAATARTKAAPAYSRSEEHTSELQSLMRISYAVFC